MPRRREGPCRGRSGYFYFDNFIGFGEGKHRTRFSLGTKDPDRAHYLYDREFRRQWDIYYGLAKPARFKTSLFSEAGRQYIAHARDIKRIKEWQTARERLNIVLDIIGDIELQRFGPDQIRTIDAELLGRRRSRTTVNHYFGLLKTFFNWAIRDGRYRGENPVREVKPYLIDEKRREYSADELNRIIEAAGKVETKARKSAIVERNVQKIVLLLLYTGMRLGQLLNLRWENIQDDRIVIRATETKQRKPQIIPVSESVRRILDGLKDDRRKNGFVLPLLRHGRHKPAWAYDAMRKIRKLSGVSDFTFHGLRHTAATIMVKETLGRGVGLTDIMGVLGHSRMETTLKYLHGDTERMRKAVEALEKRGGK